MDSLAYSDYTLYEDIEPTAKSSLGYNTNNKYPTFPPLMNDGRTITASWQPNAVANNKIIQDNHIKSNWEYRKYLTDNGVTIMRENLREASNDMGYYARFTDLDNDLKHHSTPFLYNSSNRNQQPKGFVMSDLKSQYLSREELEQRKLPVIFTQEQLLAIPR